MAETLLRVRDLCTSFRIDGSYYAAVDGIDLEIKRNEVFALVGESGCGKSAFALSVTRLHNPGYTMITGSIEFNGLNLLELPDAKLNDIRGQSISMIFQDPLSALNPLIRVGAQIEEPLLYHSKLNKAQRKKRALELLDEVGMSDPVVTYSQLPHELSGGMRQRAMIAIALACKPDLIIADEPTTALDVTIQAQILDLLRGLQGEMKSSILLITHDLGVVAEMADRVAVMYAGQIVELAPTVALFEDARHPYTRSLLASIPNINEETSRLRVIQGVVPDLRNLPREGCRFSHRIPWIPAHFHQEVPGYHEVSPGHLVLCSCHEGFRFESE